MSRGERGETVPDDDVAGFVEFQPPFRTGGRPEVSAGVNDRRGHLLRRQRRKFVGKFARDVVPGNIGAAIGRQDGLIHVDQHRAGQLRHGLHGHFTSGGIEDRIESTLPPVFSPKVVPRS